MWLSSFFHRISDFTSIIGVCSRNSETTNHLPPPLIFPLSVSPYVSRRKSDYAAVGDRCERLVT
ncbi:hypothetical protein MTR_1g087340 [Medicago truncatula]|uniref:Transmembrane protein n=1 Tax=Medicago truncatula TaxID=3880 RepID=G7IDS9_MEDTR|nr:hypothetical protein MTR_1g087340 [Medicago truncatula]